ncbi:hypothetical protein N8298_01470 [Flavobacteriaceae bacterium]|nr:hypothetical protein [Flavobacteriaceae bacterium]
MLLNDKQVQDLFTKGFAYLPQLKFEFENLDSYKFHNKTYNQNSPLAIDYLKKFDFKKLKIQLKNLAESKLNIEVDENDIYSIARFLKSYDNLESYLGHFDSHLFTIVTPVVIPNANSTESGQLIVFPKIRKNPKNEFSNFYTKLKYKILYGNKKGFNFLMKHNEYVEFDFKKNTPIIFLGRECYHGNRSFEKAPDGQRITILTHLFDPNKYGIGNLLRKIRNR